MTDCIEEPKKKSGSFIVMSGIGLIVIVIFCAVISSGCLGAGPGHYQVKVTTPGEWGGSLDTEGSHKSLSGTGSETIEVNNPRTYLTVTVWKKDNSTEDLHLELIKDGNMIKSEETNFKHGSVTVYTGI